MSPAPVATLCTLALLPLALVGCVDTTLSYAAPGFNAMALQTRGVAVGTLGASREGTASLAAHEASMLRGDLESRLAQSKKLARLTPVGGTRSPYRLQVDITRNEVESWVSDDVQTTTETIYDEDGQPCGCVTRTTYLTSSHTQRLVAADFRLLDPTSGHVAWAWSGEHRLMNTRTNDCPFAFPPPPPLPQAPQTHAVADDLVRTAVRKLGQTR
jgi:hypothetical protein